MTKLHSEARVWKWEGDGSRTSWDGLRRDNDLWIPDGDCLIYLYDEGQSRRGASIRLPYRLLFEAKCSSLTAFATSELIEPEDPSTTEKRLYLGAPSDLARSDAFNWHLTTRNFFAWLLGKPLVGTRLSQALTDLLGRMTLYREGCVDNVSDLLDYADDLGYANITGCPDLALAMLSFADEFKLASTWMDAFAHCVGMREDLQHSVEYETIRNVNKALITRAALQMDLSLDRATKSVHALAEDDLSAACVQFSDGARRHLDHFRSFLQSHLVTSYGHWPPHQESFPKQIYASLRSEFESLYHCLADQNSKTGSFSNETAGDGVNAAQIIDVLCAQNGFEPLAYTLPLLPRINSGAGHRTQAHWALRGSKLGSKDHKQSAVDVVRNAYREASNSSTSDSGLVKAYLQFELEDAKSFDDKLSFADARKIRWILIYQVLQQLLAITKAPAEARNAEDAPYPLCCPRTGLPPWSKTDGSVSLLRTASQLRTADSPVSTPTELSQGPRPENARGAGILARTKTVSNSTADRSTGTSWLDETNPWLTGQPQLPEKSQRRSMIPQKSLARSSVVRPESMLRPKSLARSHSAQALQPISIAIPDRSSSRHSAAPSIEDESGSVTSDATPSLSFSQHSPTSSSSSAGQESPMSGSSSIYSTDDALTTDESEEDSTFAHDIFTQDGGFTAPGLDYHNPKHHLDGASVEGIDFGIFGARNM